MNTDRKPRTFSNSRAAIKYDLACVFRHRLGERREVYQDPDVCCVGECGRVALRRVGRDGYCGQHVSVARDRVFREMHVTGRVEETRAACDDCHGRGWQIETWELNDAGTGVNATTRTCSTCAGVGWRGRCVVKTVTTEEVDIDELIEAINQRMRRRAMLGF